ncbi:MAG: LmeA family phospholipid-binding protein [Myxococcales bacterium]|nr:LmeA family phospholipid-binding protein [Myxococcales bacterium]
MPEGRARRRGPVSRRTIALGIVAFLLIHLSVVAAFAWVDLRVRGWAESVAEQEIARRVPQAERVEVTLDGFPFTLGLLLDHRVEGLHVHVDHVEQHGIRAADLHLDVEGIVLDGAALLDDGRLVVSSVEWARVEGFLPTSEIAEIVGHPVEIEDRELWATVGPRRVHLVPRVNGRWLELYVDGTESAPMMFPLPTRGTPPCKPIVAPLGDRLRLSCAVDHLPEPLRQVLATG